MHLPSTEAKCEHSDIVPGRCSALQPALGYKGFGVIENLRVMGDRPWYVSRGKWPRLERH
jgi:hypothetical protein